jgi:solute carrier family 50 (sugar transporter)
MSSPRTPEEESAMLALSGVGTATAILQSLSGFPLLRRVIQSKDSTGYTRAPTYLMTGTALLIGLYSIFVVKRIDGLLVCNAAGVLFWSVNFAVLCAYTPGRRAKALFALAWTTLVVLSILLYILLFVWLSEDDVPARATIVAVIMQAFNISGFASPFRSLVVAVRELDTLRVPRMISVVNLLNSAVWIGYGILLGDGWIWVPNVVGVVIALSQLSVLAYIVYEQRRRGVVAGGGGGGAKVVPTGVEPGEGGTADAGPPEALADADAAPREGGAPAP